MKKSELNAKIKHPNRRALGQEKCEVAVFLSLLSLIGLSVFAEPTNTPAVDGKLLYVKYENVISIDDPLDLKLQIMNTGSAPWKQNPQNRDPVWKIELNQSSWSAFSSSAWYFSAIEPGATQSQRTSLSEKHLPKSPGDYYVSLTALCPAEGALGYVAMKGTPITIPFTITTNAASLTNGMVTLRPPAEIQTLVPLPDFNPNGRDDLLLAP